MKTDIDVLNIRKLDGHLLLILQQLLESLSVTRTAKALNLSQSTVSHALARLRELFQDPLFVRRPHGLEPTQRALELAPRIEEWMELTCQVLGLGGSFDPRHSSRRFTLAAPEFITAAFAERFLRRLSSLAPSAGVRFIHLAEEAVFRRLQTGQVDVAVGRFVTPHQGVELNPLYKDEYCVACRKGHPISRGRLTAKKYGSATHIWAISSSEIDRRDLAFDYSDMRGNLVPHWLTALVVAAQSDSIATCPRRLAESQAKILKLDLLEPPFPTSIQISIALRHGLQDKGALWFADEVRQALS